ncbi:MAG: hypothetical protein GF329_08540 [Candidatus Lokiarchaeota archaeon]|nr:hypothetical protein [Candidatus Lokiarchaeota archaeon]
MSKKLTEIENLKFLQFIKDINTCSRCSYCRDTYNENDNTYMICPIRENTAGFESFIAKGKLMILQGIIEGILEITPRVAEIFFTCTTCNNCSTHCPSDINTVKIFESFREDLQDLEFGYPVHVALADYTTKQKNPYNEPNENRLDWIPNNEKTYIDKKSKLGYFVGCTSSYRSKEISKAFYSILDKSGVDFTILSDEYCCGSPLIRTGHPEIAEECAKHTIDKMSELGIEEIVFTCAGCLRTFEMDHKKIRNKIKTLSYLKLLERLIDKEIIRFRKNDPIKVTYHDPCHTTKGVSNPDFKTPRNILRKIPGIELIEMKSNKKGSICCGAGGGVKSVFPDLAVKIASKRIEEALETNARYLLSSCPFCRRNLHDAAKNMNAPIKVMDIVELLDERI